jgi:hypothetical protein
MKINPNLIQSRDMENQLSNLPENIEEFDEKDWRTFIAEVFLPIINSFHSEELDKDATSFDLSFPRVLSTNKKGASEFTLKAYNKNKSDFNPIIIVTPTLVDAIEEFNIPFRGTEDKVNFEETMSYLKDKITIYYPAGEIE